MKAPLLRIHADELIVDNFAGGGGASLGIEWALGRSPDVAINHDREAIAMHAANHPETRHYCEDVWKVDPAEACRGRPILDAMAKQWGEGPYLIDYLIAAKRLVKYGQTRAARWGLPAGRERRRPGLRKAA